MSGRMFERFKNSVNSLAIAGRLSGPFLVVEDDPDCSKALVVYIKMAFADAKVMEAATVERAQKILDRVGAHRLRCAFVDLHLPGGMGTEVIRRLLAEDPALPVIAYTGDHLAGKDCAEEFESVRVLLKPNWESIYESLTGEDWGDHENKFDGDGISCVRSNISRFADWVRRRRGDPGGDISAGGAS